jgi:hypothetical protein
MLEAPPAPPPRKPVGGKPFGPHSRALKSPSSLDASGIAGSGACGFEDRGICVDTYDFAL